MSNFDPLMSKFRAPLLSYLPLSWLYLIGKLVSLVGGRVFGYRKKTILKNLHIAFPEKSPAEIYQLLGDFYKHLGEIIAEIIKTPRMSEQELRDRVLVENPELVNPLFESGQSITILTAHQGNWEWLLSSCTIQLPFQVKAIYMKLKQGYFDRLMLKIRSKFGAHMIEKQEVVRELLSPSKTVDLIAAVADQRPKNLQNRFTLPFMGRKAVFFTGVQKIAVKKKTPIFFVQMKKIKRGYYSMVFHQLWDGKETKTVDEITTMYAALLEKTIREQPAYWLWSHNRWKGSENL